MRADGFALFIAVCNSPATVKELIRLLQESMPGVEIETVNLNKEVTQPLDAVLEQVRPDGRGPVMVLGLEASNPSSASHHPVLQALNLGRAEWPAKLPRPVVLWVPEFLLGLLGREAPDFLDWRSDTLSFPEPERVELQVFDDSLWMGGTDGRLSEAERRARVAELRARLAAQDHTNDPVILDARTGWLHELGNHLLFLGEIIEAEEVYEEALKCAERLGNERDIAICYQQLGRVAEERGNYDQALDWYRRSLQIKEELGNRAGMASSYHQLGRIAEEHEDYDQAVDWYRKSLQIKEELGNRAGMASSYHQLGIISQQRRDYDQALHWYRRSLQINEELGNRVGAAVSYHQLGVVAQEHGDYEQALAWYRKSLQIKEELGDRIGMASSYHQLGIIAQERGNYAEALAWYKRSLQISEEVANLPAVARTLGQLGILDTVRGNPEEGVSSVVRSLALSLQMGSPNAKIALHWLSRQRELLGEKRFGEVLREHLDEQGQRLVLDLLEKWAAIKKGNAPPLLEEDGILGEETRRSEDPAEAF